MIAEERDFPVYLSYIRFLTFSEDGQLNVLEKEDENLYFISTSNISCDGEVLRCASY